MTDIELLELAAKAAWIEVTGIAPEGIPHRFGGGYWNPLTDDGDALRLAVKLRRDLVFNGNFVFVGDHEMPTASATLDDDQYAATRRAIVRAAAEIGKSMP